MGTAHDPILTTSFVKLRRLVVGFDHLADRGPQSKEDKALKRVVRQLGATALRVLLSELASPIGGRASYAHALLAHLAQAGGESRRRVVESLGEMIATPGGSDGAKLRAIALLAELDAELPNDAELADPDRARRQSLGELATCLREPAEIARAADQLADDLADDDLLGLLEDLIDSEPYSALALIDELLVRDHIDELLRQELAARRAAARLAASAPPPRRQRRATSPTTRFARHSDGRRILLASTRQAGSRPTRFRLLCALVGSDGTLLDGFYVEDLTPGNIEKQFAEPLSAQGFDFDQVSVEVARGFLIQSARTALVRGRLLPRSFYLGRDIIGLRDEHLDGTPQRRSESGLASLLDRAIALIGDGEPAQARRLLERYVAERPDDPEGHAQLGLSLLGAGDSRDAMRHLGRAAWLDPDEPMYHWNLAAAANRAGKRDACYLALLDYLNVAGFADDGDGRQLIARRFVAEYERIATLEHPGQSARAIAERSR